jgi:N-acylneuraminate cytidylyltransferase
MSNIAIIPARGGSKRIPRKNLKLFLGKPIISYSIEIAIKSGLFSEIIVSTEDNEIAELAKQYGASVPFLRSKENSNDYSTTADVISEVLDSYANINKPFEFACCIYPTAPLATMEDIHEGFHKMINEKKTSVFPVTPFTYPVWRALYQDGLGNMKMKWIEYKDSRSQDLEELYHDAGQWYWLNVEDFKKNKLIFSSNSSSILLNPLFVQDIDNLHDWKIAEMKYEFLQSIK